MTALEELGDINEVIGDEATLNSSQAKKDNVRKFAGRQAKTANEKPAIESDAGNMKPQNPAKPITAQELPNKPDDYPKESGQANAIQVNASNPAQTSTDNPTSTDKPAPARQAAKPGNGNGKNKAEVKVPIMSEAQKSAIMNLSRRRNISVAELESLAMKSFNIPLENLSSTDASQFIRTLQTAA
jgi:hypothetical protein